MKSALSTFLIISFVGVAVFGFLSMIYGDMHSGGCIASGLGASCPFGATFAFIVFHLDAFKYLSTAILSIVLAVIAAGMIFSILPQPLDDDGEDDDFIFSVQEGRRLSFKKDKKIYHWLSLKENSPAFNA